MTSNSTSNYTWNTRNQLTGISGGTTASFLYGALGRRESKTISSTSTNFLYDGLNLDQELNGTTPTVNYLTGAGIDETLSRTDSSGTESYLTDNLGSTLALTNSAGAISTIYSYEPYGNTTATGTTSTNTLQYTGRENDGDGLYYYRARYYSPMYGRFISQDPIGLASGINWYGYAGGDPVNSLDPYGLKCSIIDRTLQFLLDHGVTKVSVGGGDVLGGNIDVSITGSGLYVRAGAGVVEGAQAIAVVGGTNVGSGEITGGNIQLSVAGSALPVGPAVLIQEELQVGYNHNDGITLRNNSSLGVGYGTAAEFSATAGYTWHPIQISVPNPCGC